MKAKAVIGSFINAKAVANMAMELQTAI